MSEHARLKTYLIGMSILAVVIAVAIIYMAEYLKNTLYSYGILGLLPLALLFMFVLYRKMKYAEALADLRSQWGHPVIRERNLQSMNMALSLFSTEKSQQYRISLQTWDDLNMDKIYDMLDRTLTSPGSQILYNYLREPLLHKDALEQRNKTIRLIRNDRVLREKLQLIFLRLDRQEADTMTHFLWGDDFKSIPSGIVPTLLYVLAILALLSVSFWWLKGFFYAVVPIFAVNYYFQNYVVRHLMFRFPAIRYLRAMLLAAQELGKIEHLDFVQYSSSIRKNAAAGKGVISKARIMGLSDIDSFGIYEYLNAYFLFDLRNYYGVMKEIKANLIPLRQTYELLGELDALIAVASVREGTTGWCEPEFINGKANVFAENICHPLLDEAVPNDIFLEKPGAILTGSNMSGKSTFLRTIGVNVLLAQSVGLCFAQSYKSSMFKIITSINKGDHLIDGKSYYFVEAEAILNMIRGVGSGAPSLCIIDEIFRGTHSLERIPAAIEVLLYLSQQNTLNFIATHDLEVAKACSQYFDLYHFRERAGESGLEFDYLLKKGITTSWNAIKILQYLGFPSEVTEGALNRIENVTAHDF